MLSTINTPDETTPTSRNEMPGLTPGPGQVLIDVEAFSLNRGELALLAARQHGWQPGQDIAGRVAASAAPGLDVGARVVGLVPGGGWSEQVIADVDELARIPEGISATDAAALPMAGLTALRSTRARGDLLGRTVLVTAASGAVGSLAVQLCVLRGANVVALAAEHHAERLLGLGAAQVVSDLVDSEARFDLVLDAIGGPVLDAALDHTAPDAVVVPIGNVTGEAARLDVYRFVGEHERVRIEPYLSYAWPAPPRADLEILIGLLTAGRLRVPIARTDDWSKLNDVIDDLSERRFSGKPVLTIS